MKIDYKKNKLQILTFIVLGAIPLFVDSYYLDNISYFMCWTFISLGLAVIWGMGGILSFGQTAFFGLAGYGFSVISINFLGIAGVSLWSIVLALMLTGIFGLIVWRNLRRIYWNSNSCNNFGSRNIYATNSWPRIYDW